MAIAKKPKPKLVIQKLSEARKAKLAQLEKLRVELRKRLESVEERILRIGGVVPEPKPVRKVRRRKGANAKSVLTLCMEILASNKKGLDLHQLADQILAGGYKTFSKNFHATVYQSIYNHKDKIEHDPENGVYRLV